MFLSNTGKDKSHGILNSKQEFKGLITIAELTGLFAGREVEIRSNYTLNERFWEMIYRCICYKDGIKAIQAPHNKKYLSKELAKLFASDQISVGNRRQLKHLIKESQTFKDKIDKINSITIKHLKQIRLEIQSNPTSLITQKVKNLEASLEALFTN